MSIQSGLWPGTGTISVPRREPRNQMASPSTFAVTYAHLAVSNEADPAGPRWETNSIIQQLGVSPKDASKRVAFVGPFRVGDAIAFSSSWRGLPLGYADARGRQGDILKITTGNGEPLPYPVDVLFAIVPRANAVDLSKETPGNSEDPNGNGRGAYRGFRRDTSNSLAAAENLAGIKIKTLAQGDDLILPNGPGQYRWERGKPLPTPLTGPIGYDFKQVGNYVDREPTLVNIGSGRDVVIGGYVRDHFGAYSFKEIQELKKKQRPGEYSLYPNPASVATGSKLFVGGSYKDFLIGGIDQDYIAGDRFRGYELYLPADALPERLPSAAFDKHLSNLRRYQPDYFANEQNRGRVKIGVNNSVPLWIPGSDGIFTYDGNDFIYGDDDTAFGASGGGVDLINLKNLKDASRENGGGQWLTRKLAADFIDAGAGDDQVFAGFGGDAIIGGLGADLINVGDQIIADGYDPFWGTKVVYGDALTGLPGVTPGDDIFPDIFQIGELLETEDQIRQRAAGGTAEVEAQKSQFDAFVDGWEKASSFIALIPKVGTLVYGLVEAGVALAKLFSPPVPVPVEPKATAADALVVIKDFDASDQLVVRLPVGANASIRYDNTFVQNTNGIVNPLIGGGSGGGTLISVSGRAVGGTQFTRVFLQGYSEGLIRLDRDVAGVDDGIYVYGGADYYLKNKSTGDWVFPVPGGQATDNPLLARDGASIEPQLVENPF